MADNLAKGMTPSDYNWLASIYYFGYLFVSEIAVGE
jgi:hypothetical protein